MNSKQERVSQQTEVLMARFSDGEGRRAVVSSALINGQIVFILLKTNNPTCKLSCSKSICYFKHLFVIILHTTACRELICGMGTSFS